MRFLHKDDQVGSTPTITTMFESIESYILKSREDRRAHLDLTEECILIGGVSSTQYKGLLAHSLRTTIPTRIKVFVCHACNVSGCSNPHHLYWGTPMDNHLDQVEAGTFKTIPIRDIETLRAQGAELGKKYGKLNGGKNKLSSEERIRIECVLNSFERKYGWITKASEALGVSHTQVKRYLRMFKDKTIGV